MKADHYAKLYKDMLAREVTIGEIFRDAPGDRKDEPASEIDVGIEVCRQMLNEVKPMAEARRISDPRSMKAVMLELRQKWMATVRRIGDWRLEPVFDVVTDHIAKHGLKSSDGR